MQVQQALALADEDDPAMRASHAQQLDRQRVVGGAEQPDRQRAGRGRGRDQSVVVKS